MTQANLWQTQIDSSSFAELCAALYQREINVLAQGDFPHCQALQARLKSLPHYVSRTAHAMVQVNNQQHSPLLLDVQNANWSAKQNSILPLSGQAIDDVNRWYLTSNIRVGLVVPIINRTSKQATIVLDCVDRIDLAKGRVRTNVAGWFELTHSTLEDETSKKLKSFSNDQQLLKPNKKVMMAACAGHTWQGSHKSAPLLPSLRELLLSCNINWKNFKKTAVVTNWLTI
ncbi:hypothetical protein KO495_13445 [Colwellia sp. D2M02]|uniref:hypothetical protein n=1 Tax=Colwellia sp. D2M02 TaxID=2841562 RepID=UPI001C082828|nr:hypothetical protein [Colwellia sp. D2M02]MBU2894313.1 hypothetical protein [Colwellia sp. D2M02]